METDPLRYDKWIEEALRGVMRRALIHTATEGLAGDHHFYITFRTHADGVRLPRYLRSEHPDEMTIVMQHQFTSLKVGKDDFEVSLSFSGKSEALCIPFDAVTAFADPSVNFGLQLKTARFSDAAAVAGEGIASGACAPEPQPDNDQPDPDQKSGEIIALDAFRKK